MVTSRATTVAEYLASLPSDRRTALQAVRKVIREHLPPGYKEGLQYGMIGYYVPLSRLPNTYNGQPLTLAGLASQKGYMSLHLMCVYGHTKLRAAFERSYKASGKKLDMGKACVRFKSVDDLPLDVVGDVIAQVSVDAYVAIYEASRKKRAPAKTKKAPAKPRR